VLLELRILFLPLVLALALADVPLKLLLRDFMLREVRASDDLVGIEVHESLICSEFLNY
jgi:hypothetical protein